MAHRMKDDAWGSWFAWHPISVDGQRVWLHWIERRRYHRYLDDDWWGYRAAVPGAAGEAVQPLRAKSSLEVRAKKAPDVPGLSRCGNSYSSGAAIISAANHECGQEEGSERFLAPQPQDRVAPEPLSTSLFRGASSRHLKAGETLFIAGEPGDGCYRLEQGLLKVVV